MGLFSKRKKMEPEEFVDLLRGLSRPELRSVVLYGSAAAGDYVGDRSDYNLLIIAERLGLEDLQALAGPTRRWLESGNPPPMLMTEERLRGSCDVFPIEILDIKDSHRILLGSDVVSDLVVSRENLRLQIEQELKGKLIQLRAACLRVGAEGKDLGNLAVNSLSSFLVLARATLRLFSDEVPPQKLAAVEGLARYLTIDVETLRQVTRLKEGSLSSREVQPEELFAAYLAAVEQLVDQVDAWIHR